MAKVTGPALSLGARGTVGKTLTFQKKGKGHAAYAQEGHKDAKSAAQLARRLAFLALIAQWNALTLYGKELWNQAAKAVDYVGTGYNFFLSKAGILPFRDAWSSQLIKWADNDWSWNGYPV